MRVLWLLVTAAGVLAFSAVPSHESAIAMIRLADWHAAIGAAPSAADLTAPLDAAARWSECRSLLLLAGGFFGLAALIRRRG